MKKRLISVLVPAFILIFALNSGCAALTASPAPLLGAAPETTDQANDAILVNDCVLDGAKLLTDGEEAKLRDIFGQIQEKSGTIFMLITDESTLDSSELEAHAREKLQAFGIDAAPDGRDAALLYIRYQKDSRTLSWRYVNSGKAYAGFTEEIRKDVNNLFNAVIPSGDVYEGIENWAVTLFAKGLGGDTAQLVFPTDPVTETPTVPVAYPEGNLPDWYPTREEREKFKFFNDYDAPRVVDRADIFTDAEEKKLADRIEALTLKCGMDLVVVTDKSDYGLGWMGYADDFYDYLGYGFGESRDGLLLFVCMDPSNRGWWVTGTGKAEPLNDNESINDFMDDELYVYMAGGRYFDGVYDWIKNASDLCLYGIPYPPEWYPTLAEQAGFKRFHAEGQRIFDEKGVLTSSEREALEKEAKAFSEKNGIDLAILYCDRTNALSTWEYAEKFYLYNGLGLGEDFDGILCAFSRGGASYLVCEGSPLELFAYGATNEDRLTTMASNRYDSEKYYKAGSKLIAGIDRTLKTGRAPATTGMWITQGVISSLIGAISAAAATGKAKRGMKTIRLAYSAERYLVGDSYQLLYSEDVLTGTHTTRTYSPKQTSSSSSSGSRSSSHSSSSHTSSSGSSHSGHGRGF